MKPPGMNMQFIFPIIFFNSSQSKLYDMDGLKHRRPLPRPPFFTRINHSFFSISCLLKEERLVSVTLTITFTNSTSTKDPNETFLFRIIHF